jgi:ABC-type amino acid transport substrate-binding protein
MLQKINTALTKLQSNGGIDRILKKWGLGGA